MKALIIERPAPVESRPLKMVKIATPEPSPNQICIEISTCAICHTDLHIVEGELVAPQFPVIPGHQIVGIVKRAGQGVKRFSVGERVGVPWLNSTCGKCFYCLSESENLCPDARFTGYHVQGGYAEYIVVYEDFAYSIGSELTDFEAAPLLCAGIIGFRALRLSEVKEGERLGLFGFGASAHIVIQIARFWKCRVFVFTRTKSHQELAVQLGAEWTGTAEDTPPEELDRAIIFAPAGRLIPLALKKLRKGGTLAIASVWLDEVPSFDYQLLYNERTIRSVTASTRKDAEDLLEIAARVPVRTRVQVFPFKEANDALLLLKQGKINGAGVLKIK